MDESLILAAYQPYSDMVLISQGEIDFIAHGLENGIRNDGRSPLAFRSLKLESGVLQQSSGSARCVLGRTEVLVAVKVR